MCCSRDDLALGVDDHEAVRQALDEGLQAGDSPHEPPEQSPPMGEIWKR